MGEEQNVTFEELLVAIDAAGKLQGDSMDTVANPQTLSPDFANAIEIAYVLALANGDQLGASNAWAILSGPAFPNGPHEIPLGGHGGENADLANEGTDPTKLVDLGIEVKGGKDYKVEFQTTGDTQDEFGCSIELQFTSDAPREPKRWVAMNATTATVNVRVQGTDLNSTAKTLSPADASAIGGVIGCMAGDMAALGVNHGNAILTKGVKEQQEVLLGGVGGELVIGSGAHVDPTQRAFVNWPVKPNTNVFVQFMSTIEAGVIDCALAVGFTIT